MMNPEKKITATTKTTPATMPTQAATAPSRERRGSSRAAGVTGFCGDAVTTGSVPGSLGV